MLSINYAHTYVKARALPRTRLETLREDFGATLREMRNVFDVIAQDFNKYPAEAAERFFTLEDKLSRIYADMRTEGENAEYSELGKNFFCYMEKRLNGTR